ncbi:MAG: hypothetical protein HC904_03715 [Blastochloris sp.]|nr:hypothetical protein [Blastochloris sp.]
MKFTLISFFFLASISKSAFAVEFEDVVKSLKKLSSLEFEGESFYKTSDQVLSATGQTETNARFSKWNMFYIDNGKSYKWQTQGFNSKGDATPKSKGGLGEDGHFYSITYNDASVLYVTKKYPNSLGSSFHYKNIFLLPYAFLMETQDVLLQKNPDLKSIKEGALLILPDQVREMKKVSENQISFLVVRPETVDEVTMDNKKDIPLRFTRRKGNVTLLECEVTAIAFDKNLNIHYPRDIIIRSYLPTYLSLQDSKSKKNPQGSILGFTLEQKISKIIFNKVSSDEDFYLDLSSCKRIYDVDQKKWINPHVD